MYVCVYLSILSLWPWDMTGRGDEGLGERGMGWNSGDVFGGSRQRWTLCPVWHGETVSSTNQGHAPGHSVPQKSPVKGNRFLSALKPPIYINLCLFSLHSVICLMDFSRSPPKQSPLCPSPGRRVNSAAFLPGGLPARLSTLLDYWSDFHLGLTNRGTQRTLTQCLPSFVTPPPPKNVKI